MKRSHIFSLALCLVLSVHVKNLYGKGPDFDQIDEVKMLVLNGKMDEALRKANDLKVGYLGSRFKTLIWSYEFYPETYSAEKSRRELRTSMDTSCSDAFWADCLTLNWAAYQNAARNLICEPAANAAQSEIYRSNPSHLLTSSFISADAYLEWKPGGNSEQDFDDRSSLSTFPQIARDASVASLGLATTIVFFRLYLDKLLPEGVDYSYLVVPNSVGNCFFELAKLDQKRGKALANMTNRSSSWFDLNPGLYLHIIRIFQLLPNSEVKLAVDNREFSKLEEIVASRLTRSDFISGANHSAIVEAYCRSAFTFAPWQRVKESEAYKKCVDKYSSEN